VLRLLLRYAHSYQRTEQTTGGRADRGTTQGASENATGEYRTDAGDEPGGQGPEDSADGAAG
jgi:hypothetical protein